MKSSTFVTIVGLCTLAGFFYWAIQQHYVIINLNLANPSTQEIRKSKNRNNIQLHYWIQDTYKADMISLVFQDNQTDTIRYIISSWLDVAHDAGAIAQKAIIETVMITHSGHMYISLSENPLKKDTSTFDAWMNIEGLLKTVKEANLGIKTISFMVHHKPMLDDRLDFSQPWPIDGFFKISTQN